MQLMRLRIIVTGMAAAVVGAAIPIAVMGWLSWQMAQERQVTVLDAITRRVLNRAELTFAEAYSENCWEEWQRARKELTDS